MKFWSYKLSNNSIINKGLLWKVLAKILFKVFLSISFIFIPLFRIKNSFIKILTSSSLNNPDNLISLSASIKEGFCVL